MKNFKNITWIKEAKNFLSVFLNGSFYNFFLVFWISYIVNNYQNLLLLYPSPLEILLCSTFTFINKKLHYCTHYFHKEVLKFNHLNESILIDSPWSPFCFKICRTTLMIRLLCYLQHLCHVISSFHFNKHVIYIYICICGEEFTWKSDTCSPAADPSAYLGENRCVIKLLIFMWSLYYIFHEI